MNPDANVATSSAYLNAENAYTDAVLRDTEPLQEKLYREMLGRILQTDLSVPYRLRGYLYFTRTEEGKQYPIHGRTREAENAPEELLLDLNALAEGHSFLSLGAFAVSDDNSLLAYSLDTTGFRQYTLQVKNLHGGETLPVQIERVTSAAWAADNRTIFYTVEDETTKRSYRLYRHTLGAGGPDVLLYEEHDERFRIDIERTRSGTFLLLTVASHTASEVRFLPATQPNANFRLIAPREDNHEYYADHHPGTPGDTSGGMFYIRTNSGGRTFRLVTVQVDDPHPDFWEELIPNRADVMLASVHAFASHLILYEREGGLPYLRIVPLDGGGSQLLASSQRIAFAEPVYNASLGANPEFVTDHLRFNTNRSSRRAPSSTTTSAAASKSCASSNPYSAATIHRNTPANACSPTLPMARTFFFPSSITATRRATAARRYCSMATAATASPSRSTSVPIG